MQFLGLCDDALNLILAGSRPFEALCLGVTCRRLHLLARALRRVIMAKFRATGGRGLCWCMQRQERRRENTGIADCAMFWGHPGCVSSEARTLLEWYKYADFAPTSRSDWKDVPFRVRTQLPNEILSALAAGGHTELFRERLAEGVQSMTSPKYYRPIVTAAFAAGAADILTLLIHIIPPTGEAFFDIQVQHAFWCCLKNGHTAMLITKYHAEGWKRFNHSPLEMASDAVKCGASVADIWALIPHPLDFIHTALGSALSRGRIDLLEEASERYPDLLARQTHRMTVDGIDCRYAKEDVLIRASELGVIFGEGALWTALDAKWYRLVAAMIAAGVHPPFVARYGVPTMNKPPWPNGAMKRIAMQGTPADIAQLAAAGCPCSRNAFRRAFVRSDPAILQALTAAYGAGMPPRLFKRLAS